MSPRHPEAAARSNRRSGGRGLSLSDFCCKPSSVCAGLWAQCPCGGSGGGCPGAWGGGWPRQLLCALGLGQPWNLRIHRPGWTGWVALLLPRGAGPSRTCNPVSPALPVAPDSPLEPPGAGDAAAAAAGVLRRGHRGEPRACARDPVSGRGLAEGPAPGGGARGLRGQAEALRHHLPPQLAAIMNLTSISGTLSRWASPSAIGTLRVPRD